MEANYITADMKQYIVVSIGNEQYGIDIQYIDNIVRMQRITRVPKAQNYFKGVINLRGEIIPVMSMRLKFGLDDDVYTGTTRIIIIKLEQYPIGIIVDEVKEVIEIEDTQVEVVQNIQGKMKTSHISGVGKVDGNIVTLLNLNNIIEEAFETIK